MRKLIVAGNWKMNKTPSEAVKLIEELKPLVKSETVDVVFCVPAISLIPAVEAVKGTNIAIGAAINQFFSNLSTAYNNLAIPDSCLLEYDDTHPLQSYQRSLPYIDHYP